MQIDNEFVVNTVVRGDVTHEALERTVYYPYAFPNGNMLDVTRNQRLFNPFHP
jgi:hypothetical protein